MNVLIFYLSIAIFIALCYCISQINALSRQIAEMKKELDKTNSGQVPAQGRKPADADPSEVTIRTPGVTKTVPSFLLKQEAGSESGSRLGPNPAGGATETTPEPAGTAASVQSAPAEQMPQAAPPSPAPAAAKPSEPSAQPSAPPPRVVVVKHFPGFSRRITPCVPSSANYPGPATPPPSSASSSSPSSAPHSPDPANHPGGVVPPPTKPDLSPIEARTAETLSKMWQWFIVGEEYRPGGTTKEYAVATTWMLRAAVILLVLGLAYFIKYSHERNLLPPELRLSAATLFALVIVGIGCKLLKGAKYRVFGTALAGAGFAGLYLCVFASVSIYHLLLPWVGLVGMAVLTAAGASLALRFDSMFLAMLSVCGGFLAPVLMNTGSRNLVGLFAYMAVLIAGSLVIARRRSWQAVNILTFLFTWGIYVASKPFPRTVGPHAYLEPLMAQQQQWAEFGGMVNRAYFIALAFGVLFFLAFCVQTVAFDLFSRRKVSLLELAFAALNGIVFMSVTIPPTIMIYGREYAAIVTFAGALVYLFQIMLLRKMKLEDRNLLLTLLVFSCGLIALTFPLLLEQEHLAVAWSVQAAAMLYIGCRTNSAILVRLSYIVYLIAAVRLLGFDVAQGYARHMQGFWTRMMNFGSYTAALAGGFFMLKRYAAELYAGGASADGPSAVSKYPRSSKVMFWCAFVVSFITIAGEFSFWDKMEHGGLVATAALYLLLMSLVPRLFPENTRGIINTGSVLLVFYFILIFATWPEFNASFGGFLYRFCPNVWSVAAILMAGVFFGRLGLEAGTADRIAANARGIGNFFIVAAIVFWFFYSTNELGFQVEHYSSEGGARIAVSLLWGFYALVLLAFGILRGKRRVRIAALVLFAVTVLKIFFYDLAGTSALYRIAGCMVTGAALVAGAWLYARFAQKGDSSDASRP